MSRYTKKLFYSFCFLYYYVDYILLTFTHTHTRTHARTHARTHTRTHARTHARTPACTHSHLVNIIEVFERALAEFTNLYLTSF